jgi:tripartite motif-containing protein 71
VDSSGAVCVTDSGNDRIQKFTNNGTFIRTWDTSGPGNGQFSAPTGIAVDSSANVYTADFGNRRIQKFETKGIFTTKWGSHGSADGQFSYPFRIVVKPAKISFLEERVFVADSQNHRIHVFKPKILVHP